MNCSHDGPGAWGRDTLVASVPIQRDEGIAAPEAATGGTAAWLCRILQAGDSYYPTGSYAHSFGLEGMIQEGVVCDRETLRRFIFMSAVPALRQAELPIVHRAWHAFATGDWMQIGNLSALCSAAKSAREIRGASEAIGRQRAELAAMLHPESVAQEYLNRARAAGWPFAAPVSAALEAQACGAPAEAALAGYYYSALAALVAAAMKHLRVGQNGAQSLLTEALATAPAVICHAATVPLDQIGWFNPWLDIAAARHEAAPSRMFIS